MGDSRAAEGLCVMPVQRFVAGRVCEPSKGRPQL
jgi:hypothetical protein